MFSPKVSFELWALVSHYAKGWTPKELQEILKLKSRVPGVVAALEYLNLTGFNNKEEHSAMAQLSALGDIIKGRGVYVKLLVLGVYMQYPFASGWP